MQRLRHRHKQADERAYIREEKQTEKGRTDVTETGAAHTHAQTRMRTHACAHMRTHACAHTHAQTRVYREGDLRDKDYREREIMTERHTERQTDRDRKTVYLCVYVCVSVSEFRDTHMQRHTIIHV